MLMLQPFDFDPKEKNKHKFMVQALYTPDSDMSIDELVRDERGFYWMHFYLSALNILNDLIAYWITGFSCSYYKLTIKLVDD